MKNLCLFTALLCSLVVFSCKTDDVDYYNQEDALALKQNAYNKGWEKVFGTIDANQDWSLTKDVKVNVSVNLDYGETYTIKVMTGDPFLSSENTQLLTEKNIKSGESLSETVHLAKTEESICVLCTNTKGECIGKYGAIDNNEVTIIFGNYNTRALGSDGVQPTVIDAPLSQSEINDMLKNAPVYNRQNDWNYYSENVHAAYKVISNTSMTGFIHNAGSQDVVYLIVDNGAKLNIPTGINLNNVVIIVNNGNLDIATEANFSNSSGLQVCENGEVSGRTLTINNGSNMRTTYNSGTIEVDKFNQNTGSLFNNGTISVTNFEVSSWNGGLTPIYNSGTIKVSGTFSGVNAQLYNNCKFTATNIEQLGGMDLANGAYFRVTNQFKTAHSAIYNLGNNSTLYAGDLYDNGAYFYCPGSEELSASIKFDRVSEINQGQIQGTFTGHYLIDPGTWNINNENLTPWNKAGLFSAYVLGNTISASGTTISPTDDMFPIETQYMDVSEPLDDDCSSHIDPGPEPPMPEEQVIATYAFEDLGSYDDYDFNDVVLYVTQYPDDLSRARIKLVAAGATYSIYVTYNGQRIFGGKEVHEIYRVGLKTMVNTGYIHVDGSEFDGIDIGAIFDDQVEEIAVTPGTDLSKLNISIEVIDNHEAVTIVSAPTIGKAPQRLVIPGAWKWPIERTMICIDSYTQFGSWSKDQTNSQWYNNADGQIYNK